MNNKHPLLEIGDYSANTMDPECLEAAKKDIGVFYSDIFGKARANATHAQQNSEVITIKKAHWEAAKWEVRFSYGRKKKPIVKIMECLIILSPLAVGYSFSDMSKLYLYAILGILVLAIAIIIKFSYER